MRQAAEHCGHCVCSRRTSTRRQLLVILVQAHSRERGLHGGTQPCRQARPPSRQRWQSRQPKVSPWPGDSGFKRRQYVLAGPRSLLWFPCLPTSER